jgi:hypothetical protein
MRRLRVRTRWVTVAAMAIALASASGVLALQPVPSASATTAGPQTVSAVLLNLSNVTWHKTGDLSHERWTVPPPDLIRAGDVVRWGVADDHPPYDPWGKAEYDDGTVSGNVLRTTTAQTSYCTSTVACTWVTDSSVPDGPTIYFTVGDRVSARLSATVSPAVPVVGRTVTVTASVAAEPDPSLPGGTVSFRLDGAGSDVCSTVLVVGGRASCPVTFPAAGRHSVTVTFNGSPRYLPSSAVKDVDVAPAGVVVTRFTPSAGVGWWEGQPAQRANVGSVSSPAAPTQIAVSSDDSQTLLLGSDRVVNLQVKDPFKNPPPNFAPVDGVAPGPMGGYGAAVDTMPALGQAQLAVIGLDHQIWHRIRYDNGTWTPWGLASGSFPADDIAAAVDSDDFAQFVAVAQDHTVWHRARYREGGWTAWGIPAGYAGAQALKATTAAIAIEKTGTAAGRASLVCVEVDGRIYRATRNADWTWTPVAQMPPLPGAATPVDIAIGYSPAVVNGATVQLGLIAVTDNQGNVYESLREDGTTWGAWHLDTHLAAGSAGVAVSATTDTPGLQITTYQ